MKIVIVILIVLLTGCGGKQTKETTVTPKETPTFRLPDVPSIMTDPAQRAEYLILHYWDHFDFTDTAYVHLPEVTEQAFSDYVDVMNYVPYPVVSTSVKEMIKKAEAEPVVFKYFIDLFEKYLYDPNSPYRNDEYYIPVLEAMLESPLTEEKIRPAHLLKIAKRNRIGEKATDFTYTLESGHQSKLSAIKTNYTIIFFYNPGCHSCKEIIGQLQSSLTINYLMGEKELTILAIYPDEDLTEWKNYLTDIPKEWINSYDKSTHLLNEEIYDLRAIPTLYLLDKDKKVLLKDTSFEQLENYFRQLIN